MDGLDHIKKMELDDNVTICFLTASEFYYEPFRNKNILM